MKTITNNKKTSALSVRVFLLTACFSLVAQYASCQRRLTANSNENLGVFAGTMISANRYGGQYTPMLYYKKDRGTYAIGPIIQNQKLNLSGVQFNYEFTLANNSIADEPQDYNLELFCFLTTAYYHNASLGKAALWEEHMGNKDYEGDPCKLRFKSAEAFAGVGLKTKLPGNFKWVNKIGFGGYGTFNLPSHLYYAGSGLGLTFMTGISFDIKK